VRPYLNKQAGCGDAIPVISAGWEAWSRLALGKNMSSYMKKITKEKRAGGIDQVTESLSSRHETLSSNSSTLPPH
jgi:hypothetical protein